MPIDSDLRPLRARLASFLLCMLVAAATSACVTTSGAVNERPPAGPWLMPSPNLRQQIEEEAKRLPWSHGIERVDSIRWFAKVGEPAYPTLLEMALDPRQDVAGAALAALGATRDSRLVEHLRALPQPRGSGSADLQLERARTLLRLGDWQSVPVLIDGLRDERMMTRALCMQALSEATHERFDFDPQAHELAREVSVQRWESWWRERSTDPLLSAKR